MRNIIVVVALVYLFISISMSSCGRAIFKLISENQSQEIVQLCGGCQDDAEMSEKNKY